MSDLNKTMLIGRLGADPEMRYTPNGDPVCNMRVATSEKWKGKDGERKEKTEWHKLVVFGKLAEVCGKWLKKGSQAYFEGKNQTRQWEDNDGNKRYMTEIVVRDMSMLGVKPEYQGGGNLQNNQSPRQPKVQDPYDNLPDEDDYPF